jgi:hypothetical protein
LFSRVQTQGRGLKGQETAAATLTLRRRAKQINR